ncbi:unnamed protein product [Sphagnum jensenii]|uniref:F-box protein n=1 Tax=Sphagnum jensenii TaxID=128206 RepID=A0ABP1B1Q9_9BRYO
MDPPKFDIIADVADAILFHIADFPDIVGAGYLCKTFNEAAMFVKKVRYVFPASENEEQPMPTIWLGMAKDLSRRVSPGSTLRDLCIIDYGGQAIITTTSILEILSRNCKSLETIDLRNMSIDTKNCEEMPKLRSFRFDCVGINADAFNDISDKMPVLQALAMRGVFGIQTGCVSLPQLKVLWLELSTKAGGVKLDLPSLSKLQLKMPCPEELCITALTLGSTVFKLEIPTFSTILFEGLPHLQELIHGESNFLSLSIICDDVLHNELKFDIPCMRLGGDPNRLGVLNEVMWNYPRLSTTAGSVKLDLPSLTNFRLTHRTKGVCPDELCVTAPALKLGES